MARAVLPNFAQDNGKFDCLYFAVLVLGMWSIKLKDSFSSFYLHHKKEETEAIFKDYILLHFYALFKLL